MCADRGQRDRERGPGPHAALDHDPAAVHLHDGTDDRQAQAAAAASGLVGARAAVEAVEDVRQLGRVDADAGVDDLDLCARGCGSASLAPIRRAA
jgi:hypothetical protein